MTAANDPTFMLEASALRPRRGLRTARSAAMTGLMLLAVLAIALPLLAILWSLVSKGAATAFADFPAFFTSEIPVVSRRAGPGMGPAILGTLMVTLGATLIAVPLGLLGAIYLNEYGKQSRFARTVRFMTVVMTGVPSVVTGLFIYLVWTLNFGYSAFGGALALACLMLPIVIGSAEQMLRLVPEHLREAAYALGATKSRVVLTVALPAALPGIVSGSLLAVARAAGETAPLLFAVGAASAFNPSFFSGANTALSLQIFGNATSSFAAAQDRAWGAALTLVMLAFGLTLIARFVTSRLTAIR